MYSKTSTKYMTKFNQKKNYASKLYFEKFYACFFSALFFLSKKHVVCYVWSVER